MPDCKTSKRLRLDVKVITALAAIVAAANAAAFFWVVHRETRVTEYSRRIQPTRMIVEGSTAKLQLGRDVWMRLRHITVSTVPRELWVAEHETTHAQFAAFTDETGYRSLAEQEGFAWTLDDGNFVRAAGASWRTMSANQPLDGPVTMVAWADAASFAKWLSSLTGLSIRLPATGEWIAICRAGHPSGEGDGDLDRQAWFNTTSGPQPVGSKVPDALGLFDMLGNVWEWHDGRAGWDLRFRRLAGGSWMNSAAQLRCDNAPRERAAIREPHIGFRLVADVQ